jgi:hypothetical protein
MYVYMLLAVLDGSLAKPNSKLEPPRLVPLRSKTQAWNECHQVDQLIPGLDWIISWIGSQAAEQGLNLLAMHEMDSANGLWTRSDEIYVLVKQAISNSIQSV